MNKQKIFLVSLMVLFLVFSISIVSAGSYCYHYNAHYKPRPICNYHPIHHVGHGHAFGSFYQEKYNLDYGHNEEVYGEDSFNFSPRGYDRGYVFGHSNSGYVDYDHSFESGIMPYP